MNGRSPKIVELRLNSPCIPSQRLRRTRHGRAQPARAEIGLAQVAFLDRAQAAPSGRAAACPAAAGSSRPKSMTPPGARRSTSGRGASSTDTCSMIRSKRQARGRGRDRRRTAPAHWRRPRDARRLRRLDGERLEALDRDHLARQPRQRRRAIARARADLQHAMTAARSRAPRAAGRDRPARAWSGRSRSAARCCGSARSLKAIGREQLARRRLDRAHDREIAHAGAAQLSAAAPRAPRTSGPASGGASRSSLHSPAPRRRRRAASRSDDR